MGPEPLSEKFEKKYLFNLIHKKQQKIKNILLDQSIVAGLGNIYVYEILFHSCIFQFNDCFKELLTASKI